MSTLGGRKLIVTSDDRQDRELVEVHCWMHRIIIIIDNSCSTSE
jgi:hypothetical protein